VCPSDKYHGWKFIAFGLDGRFYVLVMPDGSLLVSDDKAGRIYRITYAADG
jgi:glucose/arabinose dehydrogenase